MLRIIKQVFCFHVWEYELDYNEDQIKECRKCGKIKNLQIKDGIIIKRIGSLPKGILPEYFPRLSSG